MKGEKKSEGKVAGVRDKKRKGARWRKVNGLGKQDIDDVWINSWKRGGREYQGGMKRDQQYNWGVKPGMTERGPIAPKDSPAGRPAHLKAIG